MAVISISIEESTEQIVSGIPKIVTITTNIPANIYYTLDGSTPTLFSDIYTSPIIMPRERSSITLSVLANVGDDFSSIIVEKYQTSIIENARLPKTTIVGNPGTNYDLFPFGTNEPNVAGEFINPGNPSLTVNDPDLPLYSSGYDGSGNQANFSNEEYNIENYQILYSNTNATGEVGVGIGTLPGKVNIPAKAGDPEYTEQFTTTFNPKAFVIYQNASKENPLDPPSLNKNYFSFEDNTVRDGSYYYNTALDAPPLSGSLLRSHFNPRTNEITYYYYDSWANKWIISTQPFVRNENVGNNLTAVAGGRTPGSRYVYHWIPFQRRMLG
jgi:hypothetical protein